MANWYGAARTNYVKVADVEGLSKLLALHCARLVPGLNGTHAIISRADGGGWCSAWEDSEGNEYDEPVELEFKEVCEYLEPGQILIAMEIGSEKMRYLTGNAQAFNTGTGEGIYIDLQEIYSRALRELGEDLTCTACQY